MLELEVVSDGDECADAEVEWMALMREHGFDLLNVAPGGGAGLWAAEPRRGQPHTLLHQYRKAMQRAITGYRRAGKTLEADQLEAKRNAAEASIARLARRLGGGKAAARKYINEKLEERHGKGQTPPHKKG